jgi:toxin CptA
MFRITLGSSRLLALALAAAHAAAAIALVPLDFPAWAKVLVVLLVAASLVHALRRHAWLSSAASVKAIELHEHDRVTLEVGDGTRHAARVLGTTYVTPRLCVMNLRIAERLFVRHAVIVADNVDPEDFRRLRVWLRWGCRPEADQVLSARNR